MAFPRSHMSQNSPHHSSYLIPREKSLRSSRLSLSLSLRHPKKGQNFFQSPKYKILSSIYHFKHLHTFLFTLCFISLYELSEASQATTTRDIYIYSCEFLCFKCFTLNQIRFWICFCRVILNSLQWEQRTRRIERYGLSETC